MTDEKLMQAMAELQEVVRCRCDEAYRDRGLKDPHCECDSAEAVKVVASRIKTLEAKLAKAVEALRNLHGAVCGETGFAAAVRAVSGKAYPWPRLDQADADARAILAEIKGESHDRA